MWQVPFIKKVSNEKKKCRTQLYLPKILGLVAFLYYVAIATLSEAKPTEMYFKKELKQNKSKSKKQELKGVLRFFSSPIKYES